MAENQGEPESRLPSRLSPSRAQDFIDCPKKFYYKTIEKLVDPPTIHTARGTIAHTALERLFDHPQGERSSDIAESYVEPAWEQLKHPDLDAIEVDYLRQRAKDDSERYLTQLAAGEIDEDELIKTAKKMVRNYFRMEDPNAFDPEGRELSLAAKAAGVPLTGIIDRLDKVEGDDGEVRWYISDYKTAGKIPTDRWIDGKFFGMRVYAVLMQEQMGIQVTGLRLIYLKGAKPEAIKYQPVTPESIESTKRQLKALWQAIQGAERRNQWPTKTGPLCNWCAFIDRCPAWATELDGVEGADPTTAVGGTKRPRRTSSSGKSSRGTYSSGRDTAPVTRASPPPDRYKHAGNGALRIVHADSGTGSDRPSDPLRSSPGVWGGPDDPNAEF